MEDLLISRFEYYFRHPDWDHDLLRRGDRAVACRNARTALAWLDVYADEPISESDENLFDQSLVAAVKEFQIRYHHRVADGQIGPRTRGRLISEVLHRYDSSIFQRLLKPGAAPIQVVVRAVGVTGVTECPDYGYIRWCVPGVAQAGGLRAVRGCGAGGCCAVVLARESHRLDSLRRSRHAKKETVAVGASIAHERVAGEAAGPRTRRSRCSPRRAHTRRR